MIIATLILTLTGFLSAALLPIIIKNVGIEFLSEFLGRTVSIGRVDLNFFFASAIIRNIQINDANGRVFLAADALELNFDINSSISKGLIVFKRFVVNKPTASLIRLADGTFNFADVLLLNWPKNHILFFMEFLILDGTIAFVDESLPTAFITSINIARAELHNISMEPGYESTVSMAATSESDERLSLSGTLLIDPFRAEGAFSVERLIVCKYSQYINNIINIDTLSGTLSASASFQLGLAKNGERAAIHNGSIAIYSLATNDRRGDTPLASFEKFALTGLDIDVIGRTVSASTLNITGATFVLRRLDDGSLNVANIIKKSTGPRSAETKTPWTLSMPTIAFEGGSLDFIDSSVDPPVLTKLTGLDIRLGAFSSNDTRLADMAIHSAIGKGGSLQVFGEMNPLITAGEANIRLLIQNLDLLPYAPYARRYLGYGLESGDLTVDSTWSIRNGALDAQNNVELDTFKLGAKTPNKEAVKFPIRLAIALLKNTHGNISIAIPIKGTLAKPVMDIRKTVLDTLFGTAMKGASSPFSILGMGSGDEQLGFQRFSPSSATVLPGEKDKLDIILEGMIHWPLLMLDIRGSIDGEKDAGDLRLLSFERASAVKAYILRSGEIIPDRIFLIDNALAEIPKNGAGAILYLKVNDGLP